MVSQNSSSQDLPLKSERLIRCFGRYLTINDCDAVFRLKRPLPFELVIATCGHLVALRP